MGPVVLSELGPFTPRRCEIVSCPKQEETNALFFVLLCNTMYCTRASGLLLQQYTVKHVRVEYNVFAF